jgi:two-component system, response regulator YcbB
VVTFVIIDDDAGIRSVLRSIIKQHNLGVVVAEGEDGAQAEQIICDYQPDVALVDLLLPIQDGIKLIKKVQPLCADTRFIMISQANSEHLVTQAYQSGIEFFIHKPINVLEFVSVVSKVLDYSKLKQTMSLICQTAAQHSGPAPTAVGADAGSRQKRMNAVLSDLGIIGEAGTKDIARIAAMVDSQMIRQENTTYQLNQIFQQLAGQLGQDAKAVEQRVRRAISKALENTANQGIEDYYSERFQNYNTSLFDFKEVRQEMDFINGKGKYRGRINIRKFVEGLIFIARQAEEPPNFR